MFRDLFEKFRFFWYIFFYFFSVKSLNFVLSLNYSFFLFLVRGWFSLFMFFLGMVVRIEFDVWVIKLYFAFLDIDSVCILYFICL